MKASLHSPDFYRKPPALGALPWWYRPSRLLLGASLPALLIFSYSDPRHSLSSAQLFYGNRDLIVGLAAIALLFCGSLIGESRWMSDLGRGFWRKLRGNSAPRTLPIPRLAEGLLSTRFDEILMGIFLVSHLIFFRDFILKPGIAMGVLGGDVELKHTFKTIPGVTTWTQVSLLIGAIRGLRWSGVLPGRIKLISAYHLIFFGTLFVRAILWSERLALIEGAVPFFLCALPRVTAMTGPKIRLLIAVFPYAVPILLLFVFTAFESLRSWQYYSGQHASVLEFGWRRLFTYYFEAMNTGAATLGVSGFFGGLTMPLPGDTYEEIYKGLYQGALDLEYNNVSGILYVATRSGSLLFAPILLLAGWWFGFTWRNFAAGRLLGLFFPISFLGLMEIIRIPYWMGLNRVLPTTVFILGLLIWGALLPRRIRFRASEAEPSPPPVPPRPSPLSLS